MQLTGCADNPKQVLNDTIDAAHGLKDIVDGNSDVYQGIYVLYILIFQC